MKQLMCAAVALLALGASAVTDCYWTGAAGDNNPITPGNWAGADGTAMTAKPDTNSCLIFTNTMALSLTPSAQIARVNGYRFLGSADVNIYGSSAHLYGAGGIRNESGALAYFDYTSSFYNGLADYYVGDGATLELWRSVSAAGSSTIVNKCGPGTMRVCPTGTNPGINDGIHWRVSEGTLELNRASYQNSAGTWVGSRPVANTTLEFFGDADPAATIRFDYQDWVLSNGCSIVETGVSGHMHALETVKDRTLTFCGDWADTRFTGRFIGVGPIQWNPANGATFTLAGSKSTSTGSFYLDSGVFKLTDGATFPNPWNFRVGKGAQFRIETENSVFAPNGNITISYTAGQPALYLAKGVCVKFSSTGTHTLNGSALVPDVYDNRNCDWIAGDGIVIVPGKVEPASTVATWTANGGSDTSVLNPANWGTADNETLPDLTTGSLEATFPTGAKATVPAATTVSFKKVTVTSGSSFTLASGGEGARMVLGSGGMLLPYSSATCTLEVPCVLTTNQTWEVKRNLTVASSANLVSAVGVTLTRTGYAAFTVRSATNYLAAVAFNELDSKDGATNDFLADNAFGTANGKLTVLSSRQIPRFTGGAFDASVLADGGVNGAPFAIFASGETVFNGIFGSTVASGMNAQEFKVKAGSIARFRGGLSYIGSNNNSAFSVMTSDTSGTAKVYVEEKPADVTRLMFLPIDYGWSFKESALDVTRAAIECHFRVAGNTFPRGIIITMTNATLFTEVPNFMSKPTRTVGTRQREIRFTRAGTWNLCGNDQTLDVLFSANVPGVVTSATDALVHLTDNMVSTNLADGAGYEIYDPAIQVNGATQVVESISFQGGAGLSKEGVLTHYSMGTSTSTGRVVVAAGRLVFTKAGETLTFADSTHPKGETGVPFTSTVTATAGSWATASEVAVTGGTLELRHGKVFSRETTVKLSGDGKIELPNGDRQCVGALYVDGEKQADGVYTSVNLPGRIGGTGRLQVGRMGLVLIYK